MSRPVKHLPPLPAERALKVIAGRGKAVILHRLFDGPMRLSALERALPDLSQKVLIAQLRELEAHGVVSRRVHPELPPRVEYAATPLGLSLAPLLAALCDWGRRHAHALGEAGRLACASDARASRDAEAGAPTSPGGRADTPPVAADPPSAPAL
ncbi:winged helix-turn-helix transcriptional regulator [Derxia gummosa]|uniref:Winged helix-turn-helix transcriptional regulator n=1 Tax=Derxia gummosa DSM 723 TaxID=1121388 RepID=A0A8B6XB53_9BURK|nr:helix-turn-helix domain-containing protein [Derxia gummosa]